MAGAIIVGLLIAGTIITAKGQRDAGKAAKNQADAEAAWHAYNADIAQREKTAEQEATRIEAGQAARKAKIREARSRSLIGASGVSIEGSPLLVLEDNVEQEKIEETQIRRGGARRASAFESQSILDISKGSAARARGSAALQAGKTRSTGTILAGSAKAGSTGKELGVF